MNELEKAEQEEQERVAKATDIYSIDIDQLHADVQANYEKGKLSLAKAERDHIAAKSELELALARTEGKMMLDGKTKAQAEAVARTAHEYLRKEEDIKRAIFRAYTHACQAYERKHWSG